MSFKNKHSSEHVLHLIPSQPQRDTIMKIKNTAAAKGTAPSAQPHADVNARLSVDAALDQGTVSQRVQLFASMDETLSIRTDAFIAVDETLQVTDGVRGLDVQPNRFAGEVLDVDLVS